MAVTPYVADGKRTGQPLDSSPNSTESLSLSEMQAQLQQERNLAARQRKEYNVVERRLRMAEEAAEVTERKRAEARRREDAAVDAAERTTRLLRAARRRQTAYKAAIAQIVEEIQRIRVDNGDGAATLSSLSVISTEADVPSVNTSVEHHFETVQNASLSVPVADVSRGMAAVRAANDLQYRAVTQHSLKQQVTKLERENRVLRDSIAILNRGDASSSKLFHDLERRQLT